MDEVADPSASYAVLIGASRFPGDPTLHPLPAVDANLSRLSDLLGEERVWGLPPDRVVTLGQTELSRDGAAVRVLDAVHQAGVRAPDLLLVYYAGHGLLDADDRLHLALPETKSDALHTALDYEALRRVLARARVAHKVLILDCCFAGAASGTRMGGATIRTGPMAPAGSFLLGAAAATATALAVPGERHTAFSGELITALDEGIVGGDPVLRMDMLFAYLDAKLEQMGRPRPWPDARGHGGGIVLARNVAFRSSGPVLPHALAGLARAQRRAGDAFPYRLAGTHRTHLDAVYVRQDLRRNLTEPADFVDEVDRSGADDVPKDGPAVVLDELLRSQRHLIVVGSAGQGKTTMTLRLATRLADTWLRTADDPSVFGVEAGGTGALGIRVTARALADESGPWDSMIARAASRELGSTLDRELPPDLLDLIPAGAEWLVLVDGLDEIADPWNRREVIRRLAGRVAQDPRLRFLVTTRDLPAGELEVLEQAGAARYALAPFEKEQLTAFVEAWFGSGPEGKRLAEGFLAGLDDAGPRELLRVPLFATVAAILYQQHPETRLPGSVYTLYEQYLGYLAAARFEQTGRQWLDVRARVAAALDGDAMAADRLQAERGALVEHLATCAVVGESDLLSAAVSWMDDHGGLRARTRIPDWPDLIASMLDATGLFLHTPELRFVHLSLAEHLAASAKARELPATFNPVDPAWRAAFGAAAHNSFEMDTDVLLHHARLHPGSDDVLTWLESGSLESRILAGRLLADGYPGSPAHVERFSTTLRSAAGQARSLGDRIRLTSAFKAAARLNVQNSDHVLLDIANDREVLPDLRIETAALLPRRHRDASVRILRELIADREMDLDDLRDAVETLAEFGPDFVVEAAQVLSGIAAQSAVSTSDRRRLARTLIGLGPPHVADAVEILRSIIANPSSNAEAVGDAATILADSDPAYRSEAAAVMRTIISDPRSPDDARGPAAMALVEFEPSSVTEAVEVLRAIAAHGPNGRTARDLAKALSSLGAEYAPDAAEVLRARIADPSSDDSDRLVLADDLATLGPAYAIEAVATMRAVMGDPTADPADREDAADALADCGPEFIREAASVLRALSAGAEIDLKVRRRSAEKLARYRPECTAEAAELLITLAVEPAADLEGRLDAIDSLKELGPRYATEISRFHRAALAHGSTSAIARLRIATSVVESDETMAVETGASNRLR